MKRLATRLVGLFAALALLCGCQTTAPLQRGGSALRVGVSPDYPPMIFKKGNTIVGVEADMAQELGKALGRPVTFVEVGWEDQIDALLDGKTDIIMSGMTITDARKVRIAFTDPFLKMGLMALARSKDFQKYIIPENLFGGDTKIGVQKGTTADAYANRNCTTPNAITYLVPDDAAYYLTNRRIDVFIHDGPGVLWLHSEHEADLEPILLPQTDQYMAWGLRRDNAELRTRANAILNQWRTDGTLDRIMKHWLPSPETVPAKP